MTDNRYSVADARDLAGWMGEDETRRYFTEHPEIAPGTEDTYPSVQPDPVTEATDPNATSSTSSLTPADDGDDDGGGLGVAALNQQLLQHQENVQRQRREQFEAAQAELKARQLGPSFSERMFQLAAAFSTPTRTRGFAGVMNNVAPVLARQSGSMREADESRAEALRQLQAKYDTGVLEDEGTTLTTKIQLAKLEEQRRKAAKPQLVYDQNTGNWVEKPGEYATPTSMAELDALPDGTLFRVWTGPLTGRVIPKKAGG